MTQGICFMDNNSVAYVLRSKRVQKEYRICEAHARLVGHYILQRWDLIAAAPAEDETA